MRIGIDARLYSQTGVGRYIRNITDELSIIDDKNDYVIYLRKEEFDKVFFNNRKWIKKCVDIPWHTFQEQLIFPLVLIRDRLDIMHFPYFNVPIGYPKKYLLTIHDLIVDHFDTGRASTLPFLLYRAKRIGYKVATKIGVKKASWITAISRTTRKEAIDHYRLNSQRVTVTYDALDKHFLSVLKKHKPNKYYKNSYILYVGNAYPHKNLENLIQAMIIINKYKDICLVLAGNDNYFYPRLKKYVCRQGLEDKVFFFGEANDSDLVDLYCHAECLVFPSFMEGFGLPNLEALACKRLPVVSDIPVFQEIWGNRLIYFNPYNKESIAFKILDVLNYSSERYKNLVFNGQKKLTEFSWKKTAENTLEIYNIIFNS